VFFSSLTSPPPLCVIALVKGVAKAQPERSRAAARSALDEGDTMESGGGCGRLCLSPAPRPTSGATQGRSPRKEDVGRRRGHTVHAVVWVPRRDGPAGSVGEGPGAEHILRTIAAVCSGEAGAREPGGVRCRTVERGGRVVRVAARLRRQFGRRTMPPELAECAAGRADSPGADRVRAARTIRGCDGGRPQ
jgi:hypothetical protein